MTRNFALSRAAGKTYAINTTCLLGKSNYLASTIAEQAIKNEIIPAAAFSQLMIDSKVFRTIVMTNYDALITDLIMLME